MDNMKFHIINMLTSGIAAYTAFLVFGAGRFLQGLLPGLLAIIPWVLPTVLGTIFIVLSVRHYRKKGWVS